MKLLVIGGSGKVGSFVLPYLREKHTVTVFDLKPPQDPNVPFIPGNIRDFEALKAACTGHDALLYMAMGSILGWGTPENALAHLDANITGAYLALRAAGESNIKNVVHISSMSVYDQLENRCILDEDQPCDAHDHYGLSKRLGEETCRAACRAYELSVSSLRLCLPVTKEEWQELHAKNQQTIHTEASDVARAILLALEHNFGGFQAFMISGDWQEKTMKLRKAKEMLGWEPLMR
jgi:nucleoside-diphosphate-sugar epimerase